MIAVVKKLTVDIKKLLILLIIIMAGCSTVPVRDESEIPPKRTLSEFVTEGSDYPIDEYDPFEGLNRRIYKFNARFDEMVFLPVVSGYEFILPDFAQKGVSSFFFNLTEVTNLLNSLLQFKGKVFGKTVTRVIINTTVGVGGVWDPATRMGIFRQNEDFGQTLGFYKVGSGPYLVLPFLGPSSLRDAGGLIVDSLVYNAMLRELINVCDLKTSEEDKIQGSLLLLRAIDERHKEGFRYYETGSPFEYELIRLFYLTKRRFLVEH